MEKHARHASVGIAGIPCVFASDTGDLRRADRSWQAPEDQTYICEMRCLSFDWLSVFAGPPEHVQALRHQVAGILGAKGGGTPGSFSGKGATLERMPEAAQLLSSVIMMAPTT